MIGFDCKFYREKLDHCGSCALYARLHFSSIAAIVSTTTTTTNNNNTTTTTNNNNNNSNNINNNGSGRGPVARA
jgi:hypothetical protein